MACLPATNGILEMSTCSNNGFLQASVSSVLHHKSRFKTWSFCIIKISLIRLMLGSKMWTAERPIVSFCISEPLKVHIYKPNISLVNLNFLKN